MADVKQGEVVEKALVIRNAVGLHSRPAVLFAQTARRFTSEIEVRKNGRQANGKTLLSLLALGADEGSTITVTARGADAASAVQELTRLVESNFDEAE